MRVLLMGAGLSVAIVAVTATNWLLPGATASQLLCAVGWCDRQIDWLIIHHTALPGRIGASALAEIHWRRGLRTVCNWRVYHIAYHFVIEESGRIVVGRPESCIGAHAGVRWANEASIGIVFTGDLTFAGVTPAQLDAGERLVAELASHYRLPRERVVRHRDVKSDTECPGAIDMERLWQGIRTE